MNATGEKWGYQEELLGTTPRSRKAEDRDHDTTDHRKGDWKWRARLRIRLSSFSSVVYLSAVAMLTIHQAFLLHRCPHDPQSMSCALAVKVYLHDPDVRAPPRL